MSFSRSLTARLNLGNLRIQCTKTNTASFSTSIQETKIRDTAKIVKQLPEISKGLCGWYNEKFVKPGGAAPIFHIIGAIFLIGYAIHHPHIKHAKEERLHQEHYHSDAKKETSSHK